MLPVVEKCVRIYFVIVLLTLFPVPPLLRRPLSIPHLPFLSNLLLPLILSEILEYDIFEDGQHVGDKEFLYSRKEVWTGFSFFLKQFSSELLEHGVIARFPSLIGIITSKKFIINWFIIFFIDIHYT